jgi:hypothetical protein
MLLQELLHVGVECHMLFHLAVLRWPLPSPHRPGTLTRYHGVERGVLLSVLTVLLLVLVNCSVQAAAGASLALILLGGAVLIPSSLDAVVVLV